MVSGAAVGTATISAGIIGIAEKVLVLDGVAVAAGVLLSTALSGEGGGQQGDTDGVHFEEGEAQDLNICLGKMEPKCLVKLRGKMEKQKELM